MNDTFDVIKYRLNVNPLEIFEKAVKNVTPLLLKSKQNDLVGQHIKFLWK